MTTARGARATVSLLAIVLMLVVTNSWAFIDLDNLTNICDESIGRGCTNGACVNGACVCNDLWSTKTDFVEFQDCANSYVGTWILWGINCAELVWCYYASLGMILLRIEMFREAKKTKKGYGLWQNKGLLATLIYFGISTPFHFIMCIVHFVDPDTRIGFDALPTLCFFFGKMGLYIAIFLVQGTMFATTLKGDRSAQGLVKMNYVFHFINAFCSMFIGSFGFITLALFQNDKPNQVIIMRAYYFCQGLTLLANGFGSFIIKKKVNAALDRVKDISSGGNKQEEIRRKINELQTTGMTQGTLQGCVYVLMGAIPFFINKHGYFLPMSWIAMPILGKKVAHQIIADKNAKSIMARLGIKRTGTGNSSSAHDAPTSAKGAGSGGNLSPTASNLATAGGKTEMIASSMMESMNPSYAPSVNAYRKKKKQYEQQKSSFMSEGTLLEELLDPQHPLNKRFVKFVEDRFAQNEVALLSLTLQFKDAKDSKERTKLGKQIMKEFIEDGAPRAVDLPHDAREVLTSTAKRQQWVPTSLDEVRRSLMFDLKGNFLGKFETQLEKEAKS